LHIALLEKQFGALKLLLELGANLELADEEGFTPLMMACWQVNEEMVKFLLEKKAKVDVVDKNKRSCIHLSILRKSGRILSMLVAAGAPINAVSGKYKPENNNNKRK
jgi:ankyrin repeat protein